METPVLERIYLIGFMGAGKSTIGRHIAADMHWQFIDLDKAFEAKHQCTIRNYFAQFGEDAFRMAESELLKEISTKKNVVIATGGGTPCFESNMEWMNRTGLTIYLQVNPEELTRRLQTSREQRPLISSMSTEMLPGYVQNKLAEREAFYKMAYIVVDSEHLPFTSYKMLIDFFPVELIREYENRISKS